MNGNTSNNITTTSIGQQRSLFEGLNLVASTPTERQKARFSLDSSRWLGQMKPVINFLAILVSLILTFSILGVTPAYAASILYVKPAASGTGDCSSWDNACLLQTALDQSNANGGTAYEIWVAEGVHYPDQGGSHVNNAVSESFRLTWDNVQLYGGFAGDELTRNERDWVAHPAILSGDIDGNDTNTDNNFIAETWNDIQGTNAYHVLSLDGATNQPITETTVLDGFIITAGYANGSSEPDNNGGGLYCAGTGSDHDDQACNPALLNIAFSGNAASSGGGGMYSNGGSSGKSSPTLTEVTFNGNFAASGGGMYNNSLGWVSEPRLTNVTFTGNIASGDGGGIYNHCGGGTQFDIILTGVQFESNQASGFGGGMYNYSGSGSEFSLELTAAIFNDNESANGGGIASILGSRGSQLLTLTDITFTNNTASSYGGGIYHSPTDFGADPTTLTNVTFEGNTAAKGGGMYNTVSADPTLINTTFSGNTATDGGGMYSYSNVAGVSPELINVTFSANTAINGGGMYNFTSDSMAVPSLTNVTFQTNTATNGGGMYNFSGSDGWLAPSLTNVTFSGNAASSDGGGIYNYAGSYGTVNPILTNVTFNGNTAANGGGMYSDRYTSIDEYGNGICSPTLTNSILWGNTAANGPQILDNAATPVITDSIVQGGYAGGTNIIIADPLLGTLGEYGGFTPTLALLPGSPAIDTGNDPACPATDQRAVARPQGVHCDMGAFESQGFTLTKVGGDNQSVYTGAAFAPLTVSVSSAFGEPMDGGQVTFTEPGMGASVVFAGNPTVFIASGAASISATANGTAGSYNVTASANGAASVDFALTNLSSPPTAVTGAPTLITASSATLNGTVNANDSSTTVTFEYSETISYGSAITAAESPVTSSADTAVSAALTGLTPNTTYHFRVKAVSMGGTTYGLDQIFATLPLPPAAATHAATSIGASLAALNGTVNANGVDTTVTFEYGLDTNYGSTITATPSPVTGSTDTVVTILLTGLSPNATYHFRVKAVSTGGTTCGLDQTFTTKKMTERAKNGGFELYGTTKIPTNWTAVKFGTLDGKDTLVKKIGKASVKITGAGTTIKTLTQTLVLGGVGGETLNLSYWVKGSKVPNIGACQVQVFLYNGAALKYTQPLTCPTGTFAWKQMKVSFIVPTAYTRIIIKITVKKTSGSVWFDGVSLMK